MPPNSPPLWERMRMPPANVWFSAIGLPVVFAWFRTLPVPLAANDG